MLAFREKLFTSSLESRGQPTHQVQPVSPSPASRPLLRPAVIEMQLIHQAPVVLETTTAPVTPVTLVAAVFSFVDGRNALYIFI